MLCWWRQFSEKFPGQILSTFGKAFKGGNNVRRMGNVREYTVDAGNSTYHFCWCTNQSVSPGLVTEWIFSGGISSTLATAKLAPYMDLKERPRGCRPAILAWVYHSCFSLGSRDCGWITRSIVGLEPSIYLMPQNDVSRVQNHSCSCTDCLRSWWWDNIGAEKNCTVYNTGGGGFLDDWVRPETQSINLYNYIGLAHKAERRYCRLGCFKAMAVKRPWQFFIIIGCGSGVSKVKHCTYKHDCFCLRSSSSNFLWAECQKDVAKYERRISSHQVDCFWQAGNYFHKWSCHSSQLVCC